MRGNSEEQSSIDFLEINIAPKTIYFHLLVCAKANFAIVFRSNPHSPDVNCWNSLRFFDSKITDIAKIKWSRNLFGEVQLLCSCQQLY